MGLRMLVTGGAGFMGSNFIKYVIKNDTRYQITTIDSLTYAGNINNLTDVSSKINFIQGNITDEKLVENLIQNTDVVVNFAAETHNDNSISGPDIFVHTNIVGTYTLLKFARKFDVRYHQVSTDEVFGDLPIESTNTFDENTPFRPSSPYSSSKAAADLLVCAFIRTYNLRATISHSSNNYGKNQFPEKLIPLSIELVKQGEKIRIYGDGKNIRDWIYVDDHSSAVLSIINNGKVGESYNISSEQLLSNLEVAKLINQSYGKQIDNIVFVNDRPGHDLKYALNSRKIRSELGWFPSGISLENWLKTKPI